MKNVLFLIIALLSWTISVDAQSLSQFFDQSDRFFKTQVENGLVNYAGLKNNSELKNLIETVENTSLGSASDKERQAFYINAYNLQVINAAAQLYPLNSVQSVGGFFDRKKVRVAGESLTLNQIEKQKLLKPYGDARFHFVLVCGALGCPPITDFAYRPNQLDQQLDQQTRKALNDPQFIRVQGNQVELSQIFDWYASDFGGNKKAVLDYINRYRTNALPTGGKVSYYDYDWNLNDRNAGSSANNTDNTGSNNASRYIVSSTIPKGTSEVKIFNNLYTQRTGNEGNLTDRSTFFTTSLSYLYGLNNRLNIGLAGRYRRVRNDRLPSSAFAVLGGGRDAVSTRQGLTAIGPQIRYAPVEKWTNFSVQSSFVFPVGEDLAGSADQPYIDWNGATWWTQFFNDFPIGNNFSLFTEIDFLWEDIGSSANGNINRVSTPATLIFSYNPTPKSTLYALGGFSPFWQTNFDYFYQYGAGAKYQITPNFELELLITDFTNDFLNTTDGQAATFNFGVRFNL